MKLNNSTILVTGGNSGIGYQPQKHSLKKEIK